MFGLWMIWISQLLQELIIRLRTKTAEDTLYFEVCTVSKEGRDYAVYIQVDLFFPSWRTKSLRLSSTDRKGLGSFARHSIYGKQKWSLWIP